MTVVDCMERAAQWIILAALLLHAYARDGGWMFGVMALCAIAMSTMATVEAGLTHRSG